MKHVKRLDKASSIFFFLGLISSKVRYIPLSLFWPILNTATLAFYFLGYILWLIASFLRPSLAPKKFTWYSFAEFKQQHKLAAILGVIATILSVLAIAFPILLVPASWLFLLGNCIWCVAEYHKFNNPPLYDDNYSHEKQKIYLRYALLMTSITLVGALATTVTFCFPAIVLPVMLFSTLLGILLNLTALHEWIKYSTFDDGRNGCKHSYTMMAAEMECELSPQPEQEHDPSIHIAPEPIPVMEELQPQPELGEFRSMQL